MRGGVLVSAQRAALQIALLIGGLVAVNGDEMAL